MQSAKSWSVIERQLDQTCAFEELRASTRTYALTHARAHTLTHVRTRSRTVQRYVEEEENYISEFD